MLKVLLADDDAVVNRGLKKLVPWEELDAAVIGEARNGQTALEQVFAYRPDLIISDIRMPVMDGLELCRRVSQAMVDVSIILLSAYEDFSYAKEAMSYGVKDYIIKPIDRPKLNQLIGRIRSASRRLEQRNRFYSDFSGADIESRLFEMVKSGDKAAVTGFFNAQFAGLQSDGGLIREMSFKYMSTLFQLFARLDLKTETCGLDKGSVIARLFALKDIGELRNYVCGCYCRLMDYVDSRRNSRAVNLAEDIDRYVRAHFADPDLTVASMAEEFRISANYLSFLFRQVKGQNIGTLITRLRIEHSKEMLRDTRLAVGEVSRASGYLDMHYFSKVFKKSEGITPTEFRNIACTPREGR